MHEGTLRVGEPGYGRAPVVEHSVEGGPRPFELELVEGLEQPPNGPSSVEGLDVGP